MLPNVSDSPGDRMNTHNNARLTPKGREEMVRAVVDHGLSKAAAARRFNTTSKTVAKWVDRFNAQGLEGLRDRSSRPLSLPSQIPLATADAVERLRRERRTQEHIAGELGISKASVSRILKRRGLSLLSSHRAAAAASSLRARQARRDRPSRRQKARPLQQHRPSHNRTKRRHAAASQSAGWEYVHVAIDDHSRVARADIFPDQTKESATPSSSPPSPTSKASASPSSAS